MKKLIFLLFLFNSLESCILGKKNTRVIYRGEFESKKLVIKRGLFQNLSYLRVLYNKTSDTVFEYWITFTNSRKYDENNISGYRIEKNIYENGKYSSTLVGRKTKCLENEDNLYRCENTIESERLFLLFIAKIANKQDSLTKFTNLSVAEISSWKNR